MENYYFNLEATSFTPKVSFDLNNGILNISGSLYPENPYSFFEPIMGYINSVDKNFDVDATFSINLYIINSSSYKRLLCFIQKLSEKYKTLTIEWICEYDDVDNIESGYIIKDILDNQVNVVISGDCGGVLY